MLPDVLPTASAGIGSGLFNIALTIIAAIMHITINTNIIIPKGNFFLLLLIISLPFLSSTKPANAGLYFRYCFG